jgi:hypothetical protein
MEEGIQKGKQEEALALVLRQLRRRLGTWDTALEEQMRRLSLAELEELGEALLDFTQITDVVAWLQVRPATPAED